jgi:RNA polymerase sigma-70 factor (ECF subfamily)
LTPLLLAPTERSDLELATAAADGDRAALDQLLRRHVDRIFAICRRVLGNTEDAHDATQEALIAVTRGINRFDGRSQFTTWLYRVATNAALDEARRRGRRPVPVAQIVERPDQGRGLADAVTDRIVVERALALVAPEFRAAIALRDLLGMDYAEIAKVLRIPAGTVRSRIARGRAAMAQQLGNQSDPIRRPTGEDHDEAAP